MVIIMDTAAKDKCSVTLGRNNYEMESVVGQGSFGRILLGKDKTNGQS